MFKHAYGMECNLSASICSPMFLLELRRGDWSILFMLIFVRLSTLFYIVFLLAKLKKIGCVGNMLRRIRSYLSCR